MGLTGRMLFASGLLALLIGAAFGVLGLAIADLRGSTDVRRQTREQLVTIEELEKLVLDVETSVRGFVITGEERFLEPWRRARPAIPGAAARLEDLTSDEPAQLARVRRIAPAIDSYIEEYAVPLIGAVRAGDASARSVVTTDAGRRRIDALRASFTSFREVGRARLTVREAEADDAARLATVAAAVGIGGSIVLIVLFTGYLTRVIVRPLRRAAQMADKLAGGDLTARMRQGDAAEIGALERSFNAMAGSLERSQGDLADLLREQEALRRVATLVAEGAAPRDVFAAVAMELGRLLSIDTNTMSIVRYEADGTGTVVASWSDAGVPSWFEARLPLDGESVMAQVRRTERPARMDEYEDAHGRVASLAPEAKIRSSAGAPIVVEGRVWGVMAAGSTRSEPLPDGTELRIAKFTELAASAIANAESREELAASRRRIVAASDNARRRIERDLHDGAQQQLVSLGLKVAAMEADPPTGGALNEQLASLRGSARSILDGLVEIARGIHPAILAHGLEAALHGLAQRSALPVELDAQIQSPLPEEVEVAAYYVVSEALANVDKYARASAVHVDVKRDDGTLTLLVRDDGIGGADPGKGSGLVGLRDRVEALGGTIDIDSSAGSGTSVVVTLPIATEAPEEIDYLLGPPHELGSPANPV